MTVEQYKEFERMYQTLTPENQIKFLAKIDELLAEQEKQETPIPTENAEKPAEQEKAQGGHGT